MSGGKIDDGSEYKIHLDLGIQINDQIIIDYSKCQLPLIFQVAEETRVGEGNPFGPRNKEEWKKIGDGWGKTGDILINYIRFVLEEASGSIPAEKASALDEIRITMNNRYDYIVGESATSGEGGIDTSLGDANTRGLLNLFKYKAQLAKPNGSIPQCGGPTDFFRFLFDFVVPPKKKLNTLCKKDNIRAILEKPPAAGKAGQCWKAYNNQVNDRDDDYDNRQWKETPPDDRRMHCYICEVKLKSKHKSYIDSFFPNRTKHRDFQCEHLFPFTEGMLFWILYRDSFVTNGNPYKNILLGLQKREYAPVCRHCNVDLKTSLSILDLNPDWLATEDQTKPIVILNEHSINRISGKFPQSVLPNHESKYPYLKTEDERKTRLMNVFNPMVDAVNNSIKKSGVKTRKELLKFLIYKYLFYFDENIMENIQKMFIGGGGTKKLLKEKKERNTIFSGMIKTLSDLYKQYKKRVTSLVKKQRETEQAKTKAQRESEEATARRKATADLKAAAASVAANTAQQQSQQAQQKAERFNQRFREIFSDKFGLSGTPTDKQIIDTITSLRLSIGGDCGADFIKENPNTVNMMNELLGAPSSGGGSKLKLNQKGGNQKWLDAEKCNTDYTNLYGTLDEFMSKSITTDEPYISGIDEIISSFSDMTLGYVEENVNQTDKLINEVLYKTVDQEDVELEEEFNYNKEKIKLSTAIFKEQQRINTGNSDSIAQKELNYLIKKKNDADTLKDAFNRRENDSNCDPENTVEKYLKELDPNLEKETTDTIKEIKELYTLSSQRQRLITEAFPTISGRKLPSPPRNKWEDQTPLPSGTRCLRCTKGANTRGYDNINHRLYSEQTHGKNQKTIWNFFNITDGEKALVVGITEARKAMGARFCPSCKAYFSRRSYAFPTQVELDSFANNFQYNKRIRKKLEKEEERKKVKSLGITRTLTSDYREGRQNTRPPIQGQKPRGFKIGDYVTFTIEGGGAGAGEGTGIIQSIEQSGVFSIEVDGKATFHKQIITIDIHSGDKISCISKTGNSTFPPCPFSAEPNLDNLQQNTDRQKRPANQLRLSDGRYDGRRRAENTMYANRRYEDRPYTISDHYRANPELQGQQRFTPTSFGDTRSSTFGQQRFTPFGDMQRSTFGQQRFTPVGDMQSSTFGQQRFTPVGDMQRSTFGQQGFTPVGDMQRSTFGQQGFTPQMHSTDGSMQRDTGIRRSSILSSTGRNIVNKKGGSIKKRRNKKKTKRRRKKKKKSRRKKRRKKKTKRRRKKKKKTRRRR